jgi:hypothetical protein
MNVDRVTKLLWIIVALAFLTVTGKLLLTPTWSYANRPMEYKYILYTQSYLKDEELLNQLGREGWEVVGATHQGFIMKR